MDDPLDVDLALWGKSRGLPTRYPLICHLLDSAAAVEALWDHYLSPGLRASLAGGLGTDEMHARSLLAYWAGLHDICKCMSCFQEQDKIGFSQLADYPEVNATPKGHAFAAHVWLGQLLSALGYKVGRTPSPAIRVAQLLGGHHGTFSPFNHHEFRYPLGSLPALGEGRWEEQRQAIAAVVHELTGRPEPPQEVSDAGGALACGLVILADWLVSQDVFLRKRIDAGLPERGDADCLERHLTRSRSAVPQLLREAGLGRLTFKPGGFSDDFPFQPNGLQRSISESLPGLVDGDPGLLLIMAPMGEGKTEAALHAGRLMGEASGRPGYFIGLPTMATSDQMLRRVDGFRRDRIEGANSLTLLHGMAWLNAAYSPEGEEVGVLTHDPMATRWLRGSKRGLLANLSVGTIDQALMAVLRGRHNVLRMLGLVGKVLVVDEVHAYDSYMQGLLKTLLGWLGALKVPVVLLSATLPVAVGRRLAEAYLAGAGCRDQQVPEVTYPGWIYVSPRAAVSMPVDSRERTLRVETHDVPIAPDGRPGRLPALREILAPLLREGGCAAVICNTVAEAQQTYLMLRDWVRRSETAGRKPPEIRLLHSRFEAQRREQITQEMVGWFGKDAGDGRPPAAILVATQVIEQSLDLDFDVVVSDLAPIALLLQRAGRCQRHPALDGKRPAWAKDLMRLVVLTPADQEGTLAIPRAWPYVYPRALLRRTHDALAGLPDGVVAIPGAIQGLVDQVYDENFDDETSPCLSDDVARLADEQAKDLYAQMVSIPTPGRVGDLSQLSGDDFVSEFSTRLGADSGRVVCCTVASDGQLMLGDKPLPVVEAGGGAAKKWFTKDQVRLVMSNTIPVPGTWLSGLSASNAAPPAWADSPHLSDLVVVRMSGDQMSGLLGDRSLWLSAELGLSEFPATAG
ncbi:CRISPR-associated helicase/endonuclease Cas3 [Streptosporangium roseum]|uniref:CRISPR-associated helicase/endonuclease Cas3 n=1 Tax=Streptosporangium roseum TaxID=2001 RepID=UPI0004CDB226|nr:CRISPR-associated helicase/endonuclease Cas3 [Streptosporangium roseum]